MPNPPAHPFFLPSRKPGQRAPRAAAAALRDELAGLTTETRTFEAVQALARKYQTNGQWAWKLAMDLGCQPRNLQRSLHRMDESRWDELLSRLPELGLAGASKEYNISESGIRNQQRRRRLAALAEREAQETAARQASRNLGPNIYHSLFFPPLRPEELAIGKSRATKTGIARILPSGP